jgi:hypothetical protein
VKQEKKILETLRIAQAMNVYGWDQTSEFTYTSVLGELEPFLSRGSVKHE